MVHPSMMTCDAVDFEEVVPCSYCKAPASKRTYVFFNPDQSCYICDVCVTELMLRLCRMSDLAVLDHRLMTRN
jgi:hypothetical protein